jgi:UDP-N-acetylglucosamine acyltransferase
VPTLGRIHRTAIVDPKARIDSDVVIGPYALIEGAVQISSGTEIQGRAVIVGSVEIGKNNWIGHGTVIGSFPQDLSFIPTANSGVKIGENNVIHEFCTIHRGTKEESNTLVGSNNLLMAGTHLGHNTRLGNNIILENNVLLGGYVDIHDRACIGSGSVVHQFTRMGAISLLHGVSAISKDIPLFQPPVVKIPFTRSMSLVCVGRASAQLCATK